MATEEEIQKRHQWFESDPVFKSARLEVAKKLKVVFSKLKMPRKNDQDYLDMAEEAISDKRQVTIDGKPFKLDQADLILNTPSFADLKNQLGGKVTEIVPTVEQLEEVAKVTNESVKKANWPISVKGTSIFTLITAFFQALGEMFFGNGIKGGFNGFFARVTEIAAVQTGDDIANNLENGLTDLADRDKGGIGKWLNRSAIEQAGNAVKAKAALIGAGKTDETTDLDVLKALKTEDVAANYVAEKARDAINPKIASHFAPKVKEIVEANNSTGVTGWTKTRIGSQATEIDVKNIATIVSDTISKTVADKNYDAKDKEALKTKLIEETKKSLEEFNKKQGTGWFKLKDDHITKITTELSGYVDANFAELQKTNKDARKAIDIKMEGKKEVVKAKNLPETLGEEFDKNSRKTLAESFGVAEDSDFIKTARQLFIEKTTAIITHDNRVPDEKQAKTVATEVVKEMMGNKKFADEALELAGNTEAGKQVKAADPTGFVSPGIIKSVLTSKVTAGIETFFKDKGIHEHLVVAVNVPAPTASRTTTAQTSAHSTTTTTSGPLTPPPTPNMRFSSAPGASATPAPTSPTSFDAIRNSASNVTPADLSHLPSNGPNKQPSPAAHHTLPNRK